MDGRGLVLPLSPCLPCRVCVCVRARVGGCVGVRVALALPLPSTLIGKALNRWASPQEIQAMKERALLESVYREQVNLNHKVNRKPKA
jgi:hypothetical protein